MGQTCGCKKNKKHPEITTQYMLQRQPSTGYQPNPPYLMQQNSVPYAPQQQQAPNYYPASPNGGYAGVQPVQFFTYPNQNINPPQFNRVNSGGGGYYAPQQQPQQHPQNAAMYPVNTLQQQPFYHNRYTQGNSTRGTNSQKSSRTRSNSGHSGNSNNSYGRQSSGRQSSGRRDYGKAPILSRTVRSTDLFEAENSSSTDEHIYGQPT